MSATANPHRVSDRITLEPLGRRARASFNGETLAESDNALLLQEQGYRPRVYFPQADVRLGQLKRSGRKTHCPYKGDAAYWSLSAGDKTLENAAWAYLEPLPDMTAIAGHLSFADEVEVES